VRRNVQLAPRSRLSVSAPDWLPRLPVAFFTGTLGVLMKAKQAGLITAIGPYFDQLDKAGSFVSANVRAKVLALAGETP
jgi:Domain of unknown function (DUF3368)